MLIIPEEYINRINCVMDNTIDFEYDMKEIILEVYNMGFQEGINQNIEVGRLKK